VIHIDRYFMGRDMKEIILESRSISVSDGTGCF
jgi:hypothetical protein